MNAHRMILHLCLATISSLVAGMAFQNIALAENLSVSEETSLPTEKLKIAFRTGAKPFAYRYAEHFKSGNTTAPDTVQTPNVKTPHKGFVVDICETTLTRYAISSKKTLEIERVSVSIKDREKTEEDEAAVYDASIDMVCDIYSLTPARAAKYLFSPIIFLSGISYVYNPDVRHKIPSNAKVEFTISGEDGSSSGEDKSSGITFKKLIQKCDDDNKNTTALRIGVPQKTTATDMLSNPDIIELFRLRENKVDAKGNIDSWQDHVCYDDSSASYFDGLMRLCGGKEDERFKFFFGDREILQAYLSEVIKLNPSCRAVLSKRYFSIEAYTLAFNPKRPELALSLISELYKMFADGTMALIYDEHFPDKTKSQYLDVLYNIYRLDRAPAEPSN